MENRGGLRYSKGSFALAARWEPMKDWKGRNADEDLTALL